MIILSFVSERQLTAAAFAHSTISLLVGYDKMQAVLGKCLIKLIFVAFAL